MQQIIQHEANLLIHRLKKGKDYCSWQEWESFSWLCKMFSIPIEDPCLPNKTYMLAEQMEFQIRQWGSWTIEVPLSQENPWRPEIVNTIMTELGLKLLDSTTWSRCFGIEQCVPVAVSFILLYIF